MIQTIKNININYLNLLDTYVIVGGFVRSGRKSANNLIFIDLVDGSCHNGIQLILNNNSIDIDKYKTIVLTGSSLKIKGLLVKPPSTSKQLCEINVSEILHFGQCESTYPLSKNKMSLEYLRNNIHLRPRTNVIGVVTRIRNNLSYATHKFFQENEFLYIHTPILTTNDTEGAGEMFRVTTNDNKQFFQTKDVYLTVSGQLDVENYACALSKVYTFGPTFRAEHSSTSRHLSEFWMIEPEVAFYELDDIMKLSEDYVKYCCKYILDNNKDDLEFLKQRIDKNCIDRIETACNNDFIKITYDEAISKLIDSKHNFENKVSKDMDLNSEHEKYLCDEIYKKPVIIYNFPASIKAFYMHLNDDNRTVKAMDLIVPTVGELIGGSQREEDLDKLKNRMNDLKLDINLYKNYLDLRRYGTIPHSGFGLGLERLCMFVTGLNIKDVIPYPRVYGNAY